MLVCVPFQSPGVESGGGQSVKEEEDIREYFFGLDLAGSTRRSSGWAVIDQTGRLIAGPGEILTDEQILVRIKEISPTWTGIDAPLSLPRGKTGSYANRFCDLELRRLGISTLPPALLGSLTFRGMHLATVLRDTGFRIIEVYPRASERILGIQLEGEKPSRPWRDSLQRELAGWIGDLPRPDKVLLSAHALDALLCARTALCRYRGQYREVGDEEGVIVIPEG